MTRLRVDPATSDTELSDAIRNLFAASDVLDKQIALHRFESPQKKIKVAARDDIHAEIERLTNILRWRRSRVGV